MIWQRSTRTPEISENVSVPIFTPASKAQSGHDENIAFETVEATPDVVFSVAIYDIEGSLIFQTDTEILEQHFDAKVGSGRVDFSFEQVPLMDGTFSVNVGIQSKGGVVYDWREQATSFEVMNPGRSTGVIAMPVHAEIRSAALS